MKILLRKFILLERQLLLMKILYQTDNDHLVAGLVSYPTREKRKADLTVFDDMFSSSFVSAIPILAGLKKMIDFSSLGDFS